MNILAFFNIFCFYAIQFVFLIIASFGPFDECGSRNTNIATIIIVVCVGKIITFTALLITKLWYDPEQDTVHKHKYFTITCYARQNIPTHVMVFIYNSINFFLFVMGIILFITIDCKNELIYKVLIAYFVFSFCTCSCTWYEHYKNNKKSEEKVEIVQV